MSWVDDGNLVMIHYFEMDDSERGEYTTRRGHLIFLYDVYIHALVIYSQHTHSISHTCIHTHI